MSMKVRWGDFAATINAAITVTPGIDADLFRISVAAGTPLTIEADLTIDDGNGNSITFPGCRAVEGSVSLDPNTLTAGFTVRDRRWKWGRKAPIDGDYNRRDDSGAIVGKLPDDDYPTTFWDAAGPAGALHDLCLAYEARIVLTTDNTVSIYAPGDGIDPDTITLDRVSWSRPQTIYDKPETVAFVGGPVRYIKELALTAVAYDPITDSYEEVDGTELSWKPAGGFFIGFETGIGVEADRKAISDTLFKAYRLPDSITIGGTTYDRAEAMRFISDKLNEKELISTGISGTELRRKRAYAKGQHNIEGSLSDPVLAWGTDGIVQSGITFDEARGNILFDAMVFDRGVIDEMVAPSLTLVCCFEIGRYRIDFPQDGGVSGLVETVRRDDVVLEVDATGTETNTDAALNAAAQHVANHMLQYNKTVDTAQVNVYPGIVPTSPDGAISQVAYNLGESGATTSVSWNYEPGIMLQKPERDRLIDTARMVQEYRNQKRSNT